MSDTDGNAHIKSFVVRGGRFTKSQQSAYERLKSRFLLSANSMYDDFSSIFGNNNSVVIEIGFGSGSATAEIADNNRNINYIGIEVYKSGIGNLLKLIEEKGLTNVRIIEGDAYRIIQECFPSGSIAGVHLFFPDPWPKKRHHKRRLVRPQFAEFLRDLCLAGGYIYFVSDWQNYAEQALEVLTNTAGLQNSCEGYAPRQPWRPVTRFHRKGTEKDHSIYELLFTKK